VWNITSGNEIHISIYFSRLIFNFRPDHARPKLAAASENYAAVVYGGGEHHWSAVKHSVFSDSCDQPKPCSILSVKGIT
jgi:hypothetical protein